MYFSRYYEATDDGEGRIFGKNAIEEKCIYDFCGKA